jgi:FAD/FMN-containing dehydrogenase
MTEKITIEQLDENFRGPIFQPGDDGYDEARVIYNAMIDKRPRIIARCTNVADVITAVKFGRANDLDTAIRGGGHNGPGQALVEDGLVIDLSAMKGIHVDPEVKTARVEPGCCWGDVDHATHAFGMATVSGVISTTGVGGLTLGGGHGYLSRKYGLTIDNLLSADVVLSDGRLVHANDDENPDLFWALRGGGGNFGVVTSFKYRLHPVDAVIGGPMFWPINKLADTLRWYRDWMPQAPEDLYALYLIAEVPSGPPFPDEIHGRKVCGLVWCCTGSQDQADSAIKSARNAAEPLFEHVGPMPYPMLNSLFDGLYPPGLQWYWKGDFVNDITDAAIDKGHLRFGEVPTSLSLMHLYPIDGAVHQPHKEATAWSFRDAHWSMVIAGVDADPKNRDKIKIWARNYWEALHPYSAGASYINFMMEEGQERIQATYGTNYDRLKEVKSTYDPSNFFHINQNIKPE